MLCFSMYRDLLDCRSENIQLWGDLFRLFREVIIRLL